MVSLPRVGITAAGRRVAAGPDSGLELECEEVSCERDQGNLDKRSNCASRARRLAWKEASSSWRRSCRVERVLAFPKISGVTTQAPGPQGHIH
jgi:hypothetical protein